MFRQLSLSRRPGLPVIVSWVPPLVVLSIPVFWEALEIRMELEGESRMAGGDQVMIDRLWRRACFVGADVAFRAGMRLLRYVLGINEAARLLSIKTGAVMRVQPLAAWAMARFAVDAEAVIAGIWMRIGDRCSM